ncbi:MAG: hypothetical protein Q8R57_13040, partial [Bacteroidota bacterium]|nr:hypothetical protein [Bacteroidota bacterium]
MLSLNIQIASTPIQLVVAITVFIGLGWMFSGRFKIIKGYTLLILVYFFLMVLSDSIRNSSPDLSFLGIIKKHLNLLGVFFFINMVSSVQISSKLINRAKSFFIIIIILTPIVSIYQVFNQGFILSFEEDLDTSIFVLQDIYNIRRTSIFGLESNVALGLSFLPIILLSTSIEFKNFNYRNFLFFLLSAGI